MTTHRSNNKPQQRGFRGYLRAGVIAAALCAAGSPALSVLAAEPAGGNTIDMSAELGQVFVRVIELMGEGKLDEAETTMQQLREKLQQGQLTDYEASRILQLAVNLNITQGKHLEAIQDSEALLQTQSLTDAERINARTMLAKLNLQLENWDKALEQLRLVNDVQGGRNQETLYLLGLANYRLQQTEQAVQYLEQAIAIDAAKAGEPVYSLLGVIYVDAKDYPRATTTYETLLRNIPQPVQGESYHSTLAQLYVQAGDSSQARTTLELLISKYPNSPRLSDYQKRLAALN